MSTTEALLVTDDLDEIALMSAEATPADLDAVIESLPPQSESAVARAREILSAERPANATDNELIAYYSRHAAAARIVGDLRQELNSLESAIAMAEGADPATREYLLWRASVTANLTGSRRKSIEFGERSIAANPTSSPLRIAARKGTLAGRIASGGDFEVAEALIGQAEALLEGRRSSGARHRRAVTSRSVFRAKAQILARQGRYEVADGYFRKAVTAAEDAVASSSATSKINDQAQLALTYDHSSANLVRQGRLAEAEVEARKSAALGSTMFGVEHVWTLRSLVGLAEVFAGQDRNAEAEAIFRRVYDVLVRRGQGRYSTAKRARIGLASALTAQGKYAEAVQWYSRLAADGIRFPALDYGIALLATDGPKAARGTVEDWLKLVGGQVGERHLRTAEARGFHAVILAGLQERRTAYAEFRAATEILLERSREDDDTEASAPALERRLGLILTGYVGLLADIAGTSLERELGIDASAEAFRMADVARQRSVQLAVAASSARAAADNADLADLIRREQDARKRISALLTVAANLRSLPAEQQDHSAMTSLGAQIGDLRRARAALAREIERRFPAYDELANPKPATIETLRLLLRDDEAMISTFVTDERLFVWSISRTGSLAMHSAPLGKAALANIVRRLRHALNPADAATVGDVPPFDVALAHFLYRHLLEPVRPSWNDARTLLVVAHDSLGQLPLSLLVTAAGAPGPDDGIPFTSYRQVPWLARSHAVSALPSVAALVSLRAAPPPAGGRRPFLGIGDPIFSLEQAGAAAPEPVAELVGRGAGNQPIRLRRLASGAVGDAELAKLPRLPDTAEEIRAIAAVLNADPARDVLVGAQASESMVKSIDLSRYAVIALATHGLVPGDLPGLAQPALALSTPRLGPAAQGDDGLLTMGEILALRLDADWVILSACNTAAANGSGSEAFSGLGRAFFYAGTRAVLLSNWPVESASARLLTTELFHRLDQNSTLTRAQALREAMLALIDRGGAREPQSSRMSYSYAHPLFWAPFSLVGEGGR